MFCPECRKYWKAVQQSEGPIKPRRKRKAATLTCPICGTLLAPDRLLAEFPAPEQAAHQAGAVGGELRITVRDVLRETAGPNAVSGVRSGEAPLAPDDREDEFGRIERRGWDGSFPARRQNSDWNESDTPVIPREFRRLRLTVPPLDLILGFGALAAIIVLVVSVSIRALEGVAASKAAVAAAAAAPTAKVVAVTAPTKVAPAQPTFVQASLPQTLSGGWTRIESGSLLTPVKQGGVSELAASYRLSGKSVRVWVQKFESEAGALAGLRSLENRGESVVSGASAVLKPYTGRWIKVAGRSSLVFDAPDASGSPSAPVVLSATPGTLTFPHMRSWQAGMTVVTVASESAKDRDDFVRSYADQG